MFESNSLTEQNYLIISIIPSRFSIKDCRIASLIHSQHLDVKKEEPYETSSTACQHLDVKKEESCVQSEAEI